MAEVTGATSQVIHSSKINKLQSILQEMDFLFLNEYHTTSIIQGPTLNYAKSIIDRLYQFSDLD